MGVVGKPVGFSEPYGILAGRTYSVQKYPLLWLLDLYYSQYKDNTFFVPASKGSFVYAGNAADYAKVTEIDLADQDLTTDFTEEMLGKFVNLVNLFLQGNDITILDLATLGSLESLDVSRNTGLQITDFLSLENLVTFQANDCNLPSLIVPSSLVNFAAVRNNIPYINFSNHSALKFFYLHSNNNLTPENLLQILTDLNTANVTGAFLSLNHIFNGLSQRGYNYIHTGTDAPGVVFNSTITLAGDFEIECIIKRTATEGGALFSNTSNTSLLYLESNNTIRLTSATPFSHGVIIPCVLVNNQKVKLKITRVGNIFTAFVNNVSQGSVTYTAAAVKLTFNKFGKRRNDLLRQPLSADVSNLVIKNIVTGVTHTYNFTEITTNNSVASTTDETIITDSTGGSNAIHGVKDAAAIRIRMSSLLVAAQVAALQLKGNTILLNHDY